MWPSEADMAEKPRRAVLAPGVEPGNRIPGESGSTKAAMVVAARKNAVKLSRPDQPTGGVLREGLTPADQLESRMASATPAVRAILEKSLNGKRLRATEIAILFEVEGADFEALQAVADYWRREEVGETVTFVVNRNINFTNVCGVGCGFCAFSTAIAREDAYFLSPDQVADRAEECWRRGGTEICVQGGIHPKLEWTYYRDVLRAVKVRTPAMHCHAFSPMEIVWGARKASLSIRDYLMTLKDEGLDSLPGTAAEILVDEIRKLLAPKKESVAEWVEVVTTAHSLGIPTTATIMFGHIETVAQRVEHLVLLRSIQDDTGGFTEFVPLPFVHEYTPMYIEGRSGPGPTRLDAIRMHSVARLTFRGSIRNIQASWVKLGIDGVQECLQSGCNDFGGTLMEESISRLAGAVHGQELGVEEIRNSIEAIGRVPRQRSTTYGDPPQRFPLSDNS